MKDFERFKAYPRLKGLMCDADGVLFKLELIQKYAQQCFPKFSTEDLQMKEMTINALKLQYVQLAKIIERAMKRKGKPKLPDFSRTGNDVIRNCSSSSGDWEYDYYVRPLRDLEKCIKNAINERDLFLELRDAALEADGKLPAGVGIMPYDKIYSEENWQPYAKENLKNLYDAFGSRLVVLTAHNGIDDMHGRELDAKKAMIHSVEPNIPVLGTRYHIGEHDPNQELIIPINYDKAVRRPINNKAEILIDYYDCDDDLTGYAGADDSYEVCMRLFEKGASPIWITGDMADPYNPEGFATCKSIRNESIYRVLNELGYDGNGPILQKPKTKTKVYMSGTKKIVRLI